jgi:hypothetical protein
MQDFGNFFSGLQGLFAQYGTIVDRDVVIVRKGRGKDTDYRPAPLDPVQMLNPAFKIEEREGGFVVVQAETGKVAEQVFPNQKEAIEAAGTIPFDLRDPRVRAVYDPPMIDEIIDPLASDSHYGRLWDLRVKVDPPKKRGGDDESGEQPNSGGDANPERLAELAARASGQPAAETEPQQATEAAPAASSPGSGSVLTFES